MAITLTFNDDLYRVQIALTGLTQDAVRIERSPNELHWEIVRGGVAIPVAGGEVTLDDYEYVVNDITHYRVLDANDLEGAAVEADDITVEADEVILKSVRYPLLNQAVKVSDYSELDRGSQVGTFAISGRSFPVAVTDVNTAVTFELALIGMDAQQTRKLDLLLALGDILYLQVPPGVNPRFPPRSMYFVATSSRVARVGVREIRMMTAPLVEVAAPGPDVVGTTLTWQTVWNQYADWTSLWNANPSWRDLLETVGSGEDLVVI